MRMPGFNADASLYRAKASYVGLAQFPNINTGAVQPASPCVAACMSACLHGGTASFAVFQECSRSCTWLCRLWPTYPFGRPGLPFWVISIGESGAGAAGAGGISLWWLIPGAIVGTIIGGAAGLGIEWLLTPETPTTSQPPSCRTTSNPPVTGTTTGCYWGCRRSLSNTINDAEEFCGKLTNYCTGTCPNGTPCKPTAAAIPRPDQGWCWAGCETTVDFTCVCGC